MTKSEKSYDTALRIFEILKILLDKDLSKSDLMEEVKDNSLFANIYTAEAFIKYFNTLEILGFKIEKSKNIYKLRNTFYKINLTEEEKNVLISFIKYIRILHNTEIETQLRNFFYKILKYIPEENQNEILNAINQNAENLDDYNNLISNIEKLISDGQQISLTYSKSNKTIETIIVELKHITEKNGNFQIVCYDLSKHRNRKIYLNSIISLKQMPSRIKNVECSNSVVFKLYGRLAKAYKIKEDEKMINFENGYLIISNSGNDREGLLKRLLKYGENCKIERPKDAIDEFIALTDDVLKNLEEE